jgi:hypothetical protein
MIKKIIKDWLAVREQDEKGGKVMSNTTLAIRFRPSVSSTNPWDVLFTFNGKPIYLGFFPTREAATAAYKCARELHLRPVNTWVHISEAERDAIVKTYHAVGSGRITAQLHGIDSRTVYHIHKERGLRYGPGPLTGSIAKYIPPQDTQSKPVGMMKKLCRVIFGR